ncbi:hypothetical protein O181_101877 [Austropuccinia psidii MF-1]|uniref:Uncharacterized protein n=1 Tax=Austropuccinia psidii MF-1 TaxID=1389203 RepID=A0A9Q3PIY6_9BASI|nr:hypothetical protein [Austropuccinia psidii MF-1]
MICLVKALNLDLKMSSKLTSICDSDHSDSPPSVLYGSDVFDNLRELSEVIMAPTETWEINQNYNGFESVRVIEPPCINFWKKGVPCVEFATARSTRCQFCNLGKRNFSQPTIISQKIPEGYGAASRRVEDLGWKLLLMNLQLLMPPLATPITNTSSSWANTGGTIHPQGNPIGVAPEVPILVTRKDGRLGKLKGNLVVQDENDTDAEGSDEINGEELEITTPIQKRRIQSTSISPVQACTTTNEVIRPPQPPQHPIIPPTRPSTLASTSTNNRQLVARTYRDPMSSEPESIFDNFCLWNITGSFTD